MHKLVARTPGSGSGSARRKSPPLLQARARGARESSEAARDPGSACARNTHSGANDHRSPGRAGHRADEILAVVRELRHKRMLAERGGDVLDLGEVATLSAGTEAAGLEWRRMTGHPLILDKQVVEVARLAEEERRPATPIITLHGEHAFRTRFGRCLGRMGHEHVRRGVVRGEWQRTTSNLVGEPGLSRPRWSAFACGGRRRRSRRGPAATSGFWTRLVHDRPRVSESALSEGTPPVGPWRGVCVSA
eukprot:scaffold1084_cov114-Isochrysis_galbana.AAC.10